MRRKSYQLRIALVALLAPAVFIASGGFSFSQDEAEAEPSIVLREISDESPPDNEGDAEAAPATAQEAGAMPQKVESDVAPVEQRQKHIELEAAKAELRKSVMAGLLVLSLICIVFLVLIVLVALWARRIRMLTRQPLPEQHPGDPLWYLRKGKESDSADVVATDDDSSLNTQN